MYPAGVPGVRVRWAVLPTGVKLRVAESGEPGHPAVLLIHGWGASIYMWRDWFAPLAAAGRHVIAIDLPGHGLSDKPDAAADYRLESMVAAVRAFIARELAAPVDVVAQSMAGTIALELATEPSSRVRGLVLVNPACFGRIRILAPSRLISPRVIDAVLPAFVRRWIVARAHRMVFGDASKITSRDIDEYWAPSQFASYSRAMRKLVHEFQWQRPPVAEMRARLLPIDDRLMVVLGTRDHLVVSAEPYVDAMVEAGGAFRLCRVDGGGHAINEERPAEVIQAVLPFLDTFGNP